MIWLVSMLLISSAQGAEPAPNPVLIPDRIIRKVSNDALLEVQIVQEGISIPVRGLRFREPEGHCTEEKKTRKILAYLSNPWFRIVHQAEVYRIEFEAPCLDHVTARFEKDAFQNQTLLLWNTTFFALSKLEAEVGLEFWRTPLIWFWPAEKDSYTDSRLQVAYPTNPEVIAHEIGHAVYDLANIGAFHASEHRFEDCSDPTLALTEGWASFFAAWVLFDLADPAPAFHHLVERLSSIPIETIPSFVCNGPSSEWRVMGFLWDLVDHPAQDDDPLSLPFGQVFRILKDTRVQTVGEVMNQLKRAHVDSEALQKTWDLNFPKTDSALDGGF